MILAIVDSEAPVRDRLQITLFLAALFHGIIILGISFGAPAFVANNALPALEVLLRLKDDEARHIAHSLIEILNSPRDARVSHGDH